MDARDRLIDLLQTTNSKVSKDNMSLIYDDYKKNGDWVVYQYEYHQRMKEIFRGALSEALDEMEKE